MAPEDNVLRFRAVSGAEEVNGGLVGGLILAEGRFDFLRGKAAE